MVDPRPFTVWGMDMIKTINPKASNSHHFILIVTDYFMKWVEATAYLNVMQKVVKKFIKRDIICHYSSLEIVFTYNAQNLNDSIVQNLL